MRFNPALDKLTAYKAGPSLAEIKERYQTEQLTELSANETPWGPFPEALDVMRSALGALNRYPDGAGIELKSLLSKKLGVPSDMLCLGNGSCELIMLLGQAVLGPGRHAVIPHPSFVMYKSVVLAYGGPYTAVALDEFSLDLPAMCAAIKQDTSLVILCNPNNPTGGYRAATAIRSFVERVPKDVLIILDEAYIEFVTSMDLEETASWTRDFPNLVILRTFSKMYGLAGLRVGYAIADPEVIQALDKVRQPFNVDTLAQLAASESLRHPERVAERRENIASEKARIYDTLQDFGVRCYAGQANFILVDVTGLDVPGAEVPQALLSKGILTRSGYAMACPGWIRVTIGDSQENDRFIGAVRELRAGRALCEAQVVDRSIDAGSLSPES